MVQAEPSQPVHTSGPVGPSGPIDTGARQMQVPFSDRSAAPAPAIAGRAVVVVARSQDVALRRHALRPSGRRRIGGWHDIRIGERMAGTLTPAPASLSWNVMAPSPELAVTMFQ